jgi:hypothetical protein
MDAITFAMELVNAPEPDVAFLKGIRDVIGKNAVDKKILVEDRVNHLTAHWAAGNRPHGNALLSLLVIVFAKHFGEFFTREIVVRLLAGQIGATDQQGVQPIKTFVADLAILYAVHKLSESGENTLDKKLNLIKEMVAPEPASKEPHFHRDKNPLANGHVLSAAVAVSLTTAEREELAVLVGANNQHAIALTAYLATLPDNCNENLDKLFEDMQGILGQDADSTLNALASLVTRDIVRYTQQAMVTSLRGDTVGKFTLLNGCNGQKRGASVTVKSDNLTAESKSVLAFVGKMRATKQEFYGKADKEFPDVTYDNGNSGAKKSKKKKKKKKKKEEDSGSDSEDVQEAKKKKKKKKPTHVVAQAKKRKLEKANASNASNAPNAPEAVSSTKTKKIKKSKAKAPEENQTENQTAKLEKVISQYLKGQKEMTSEQVIALVQAYLGPSKMKKPNFKKLVAFVVNIEGIKKGFPGAAFPDNYYAHMMAMNEGNTESTFPGMVDFAALVEEK